MKLFNIGNIIFIIIMLACMVGMFIAALTHWHQPGSAIVTFCMTIGLWLWLKASVKEYINEKED